MLNLVEFSALIFLLSGTCCGVAPFLEDCQFLDLTHSFAPTTTLYWGGTERFQHEVVSKGQVVPGNYYYEAYRFKGAEHGGTHLDAPSHFNDKGLTVDQIVLNDLIGPACVVNVVDKVKRDGEYQMTVKDLQDWENLFGNFNKCILLMRTDWDKKYSNINEYFGTNDPTNQTTYRFPGISAEAAQWLADNRRIKIFGLDTPSQDYGQSIDFVVHRIFSRRGICGLENLTKLGKLPPRGATIVAMPMKIGAGSGGPARVFAYGWNGPDDPCARKSV